MEHKVKNLDHSDETTSSYPNVHIAPPLLHDHLPESENILGSTRPKTTLVLAQNFKKVASHHKQHNYGFHPSCLAVAPTKVP